MKKKTTTDIEVTKVIARKLDTNPVSNKDNKQEKKQNKKRPKS